MSASTTSKAETQKFPGNCTLEKALDTIVNVYHRYSIRESELDLLSFNDFNTLMKEQAPNFLQVCGQGEAKKVWDKILSTQAFNYKDRNRSGYLKQLFQETDLNKDKELTFEEFVIVLAKVTDDAHRISHGQDRCGPDRD